jgi:peptidoglycan/LPS O-acetylase OafA/YrhL
MWHLPLLFVYTDFMSQHKDAKPAVLLLGLLAWVAFIIFPISLTLYRWIEMPGMRLGELVIQRIWRPKNNSSKDTPQPMPGQETTALPTEVYLKS